MTLPPTSHPLLINRKAPHLVRMDWIEQCASLPGKTLHLGMAIWWLAGIRHGPRVQLTRRTLARFGISRDACYPGLKRLEEARLVSVWRLPGRAPMVTLIERDGTPLRLPD